MTIRISRQLTNDDASAPPASLPRRLPLVAKMPAITARCAPLPAPPPRPSISVNNARGCPVRNVRMLTTSARLELDKTGGRRPRSSFAVWYHAVPKVPRVETGGERRRVVAAVANDKIRSYLLATAIEITFVYNDEANIECDRTMSRPGMTVNTWMSHLSTRMIDDEGARLRTYKSILIYENEKKIFFFINKSRF